MILRFFKRYGWMYIPGIIFLVASSYIGAMAPDMLGKAFDAMEAVPADHELVTRYVLYIVLIALGAFVTRFIWRQFIIGNSRNMQAFLRNELFVKMQNLPVSYFNHAKTGDLMAYAINDVNAVRMSFGPAISMFLTGIGTSVFSVASMLVNTDSRLTLIALLPIIPAMIAIFYIGSMVRRKFRRVQEQFALLSGRVQENISGMRVLKAFVQEDDQIEQFDVMSSEMMDLNVDLTTTSAAIHPLIQVFFGISTMVAIIYGGGQVLEGGISLGGFVAFTGYLSMIMMPVIHMGRIVNLFQRGVASFKRLSAVIDRPGIPEEEDAEDGLPDTMSIEMRNLDFTYPDGSEPVLSGVNVSVKAGGSLGICGPTGSGKTTLALLMLKLFNAERGSLFVGDKDVRDIPARALREGIGYVPQDAFLFNTTLRENIMFYHPDATEDDLAWAVRVSGLQKDLGLMPDGLDTVAGERGNHLSGGQKQRTSIARALLRRPQLVILDDALSAVDMHMERFILDNLHTELSGRTSVIIAHRLTALHDCDVILVMEDGRVAESGTHEELMALDGRYAATFRSQMEEVGA